MNDLTQLWCGDRCFIKGQRPVIMGILNVTPDSFSDGMAYFDPQRAIEHGAQLLAQGADVLDVGGVSTAPQAEPVSLAQEAERVLPVIAGLSKRGIRNISIDTTRAIIAQEALKLGASWINDQSGGCDDAQMGYVMKQAQGVVLMHRRGQSGVQAGESISYADLMGELEIYFQERIAALKNFGVDQEKIIIDPGIGFGKGLADSLKIIANIRGLASGASWTLLGLSRKSFLGKIAGIAEPKERDFATLGANLAAILNGADIIRTHNVGAMVSMLEAFKACLKEEEQSGENLYAAWR